MKRPGWITLPVLLFLIAIRGVSQISPPGIDGAWVVNWDAIGFQQRLHKKWSVTAYVGEERQSNPDNLSLLGKQAMVVINQETNYLINRHWQIALCNSFRWQNRYQKNTPFDYEEQRNESRYYARIFYRHEISKVGLTYSFRPEFRTYYFPGASNPGESDKEVRLRLKIQTGIPVGKTKKNTIIIANEWLTATKHTPEPPANASHWSVYNFTEDRLTTYLRHNYSGIPIIMDIGFMHQFVRVPDGFNYVLYLSLDLLYQNPFSFAKKSQNTPE